VAKLRSLAELCGLRVSVEKYIATKGHLHCKRCQHFGQTHRYCGYAPRCVACVEAHLSGECCTSKQQLKWCSCGGNHTANYRGSVKWKESKAAIAKRTPVLRSKEGCAHSLVAPNAKRAEPSSDQEKLGLGWNHVVCGAVFSGLTQPIPAQPPTQSLQLLHRL
jgi:hypothetical protein